MPLYDYTCRKCSHSFELLVSGKEAAAPRCPACESADVERLLALPVAACGAPWCGRKT